MRSRTQPRDETGGVTGMGVEIGGASDTGPRPDNQDRWDASHDLAVLSDGVGGHDGGARAAELSVAAVMDIVQGTEPTARGDALVRHAFDVANTDVRRERTGRLARMGATLTVAAMRPDESPSPAGARWVLAHVGDSPAFVVRGGRAVGLTADHTVPGQMVPQGLLTTAEAERHPYRNVLLQAVGIDDTVAPDIVEVTLDAGDALVLLSDGVSGVLAPDLIGELVAGSATASSAARALVDAAILHDAHDNMTAVVVRCVASSAHVTPGH